MLNLRKMYSVHFKKDLKSCLVNEKHPMLDTPDDFIGDGNEGMFVFQKEM